MSRLLTAALALFGGTSLAGAPPPSLLQAKVLYDEFAFGRCVEKLAAAAREAATPADRAQVELYGGLCEFNLGHEQVARERFRRALELDSHLELPPYTSPKISRAFEAVRPTVTPGPEAAPAPALAPEAVPPPAAVRSPPPPPLPGPEPSRVPVIVASSVAVASLGVGIGFGLEARRLEGAANTSRFESDRVSAGSAARTDATGANVAYGTAIASAVVAAVLVALGR